MKSLDEEELAPRGTTAAPFEEEDEEDLSNVRPKGSANGKRNPGAASGQKKRKKDEISK